jgi:hypothetical protein
MLRRDALALLSALVLIAAVPAGAVEITFRHVADDGSGVNSVQTTTMLTTAPSGAQYLCYINDGFEAVVARMAVGGSTWSKTVVGTVLADAHNTCSVGIDAAGYVHVAWDLHNAASFAGRTAISTAPDSNASFAPETIGGAAVSGISYPDYYRGGTSLYLLFRCFGTAGNGDTCVKRYAAGVWSDVAIPLISGTTLAPTDSSYLGNSVATAAGDLHLVWTTRIGSQNRGVHYARFEAATGAWKRSDGSAYVLPVTRLTAENVLGDNLADTSLLNTGLSLAIDTAGVVHVGYSRVTSGHREVFVARRTALGWEKAQVSRVTADRLPICSLPSDPAPGPCDLEVMGPVLLAGANGLMTALYSISTAAPPESSSWLRPASELFSASSSTGRTWVTRRFEQPVYELAGELSRDSSGASRVVYQTVGTEAGPVYVADVGRSMLAMPSFSAMASFPSSGHLIDIPDSPAWDHPAGGTLAVLVRPSLTNRPMVLVEAEGGGLRELRLMMWTCAHDSVTGASAYSPACVQVVLGNASGGLGLLWYPAVTIPQGELSHVALVWDGTTASIYVNGVLSAQTPFAGVVFNGSMIRTLGVLKGYPQYNFEGWMGVEFYGVALAPAQVMTLFERGDRP